MRRRLWSQRVVGFRPTRFFTTFGELREGSGRSKKETRKNGQLLREWKLNKTKPFQKKI